MAGINKVFLIGYIDSEPFFTALDDSGYLLTFTLVTEERVLSKNENTIDKQLHKIVLLDKFAINGQNNLRRGLFINIEGRVETKRTIDGGKSTFETAVICTRFVAVGRESDFVENH